MKQLLRSKVQAKKFKARVSLDPLYANKRLRKDDMVGKHIDGWGFGSLLLPSLQFMINEHLTSDFGMTNTRALGRDPQRGIFFSIRTR